MSIATSLIGKRFGGWTVKDENALAEYPRVRKGKSFLCQCDCGATNVITQHSLLYGQSNGCRECGHRIGAQKCVINLSGKRFGSWLVVERQPGQGRARPGAYWLCRCDCGKEKLVHTRDLRTGHSSSCGCSQLLKPFEVLYKRLVKHAKKRQIICTLSYEEFLEYTRIKECFYCGASITWAEHSVKTIENGCRTNLDRKDNSQGYEKSNLVVCCWPCNNAKGSHLTHEEMIAVGHIRRRKRESSQN